MRNFSSAGRKNLHAIEYEYLATGAKKSHFRCGRFFLGVVRAAVHGDGNDKEVSAPNSPPPSIFTESSNKNPFFPSKRSRLHLFSSSSHCKSNISFTSESYLNMALSGRLEQSGFGKRRQNSETFGLHLRHLAFKDSSRATTKCPARTSCPASVTFPTEWFCTKHPHIQ